MKKLLVRLVLILLALSAIGKLRETFWVQAASAKPMTFQEAALTEKSRSFYMGFSTFPPDMVVDSIVKGFNLSNQNADIRLVQLDSGIPWPEMYSNSPVPKRIQGSWQSTRDNITGKKRFLAITPFNFDRSDISPIATVDADNQPLPADWKGQPMNGEKVKQAFLNYSEAVIDFWQPDYLAISIEANLSANKNFTQWVEYLDLHKFVYQELKKRHPLLPIFATIEVEHFLALRADAKGKAELQRAEVRKLMDFCDIVALSVYPYSVEDGKFSDDYFDAFKVYRKPIAISETGWPAQDYKIYGHRTPGSQEAQALYLRDLFRVANRNEFVFVINWVNVDFNKLLAALPEGPIKEISNTWKYNGLWDENFNEKLAYKVWKAYFDLSKR